MNRLVYEVTEGVRIAFAQIAANKMRSALTALGVIIGIVAVTLMGTAIRGIDTGFQQSLDMFGADILYVDPWPWVSNDPWWFFRNRPAIKTTYADQVNKIIEATPNSLLQICVPSARRGTSIKAGDSLVSGVYTQGTTVDYLQTATVDIREGRFFNEVESNSGREVCVLGNDVADALFPGTSALGETVVINGHRFQVVGVFARMGSFLGIFSFDSTAVMPIGAYNRFFSRWQNAELRVKVKDKERIAEAKDELTGIMRRIRGLSPEQKENFSVNQSDAFREQLDPVKNTIALAGLFITGLSLFVGAIGIMNITFVSVKERTKEIGTRKALGARRRTILLQFLIEAVSICLVGGLVGLGVAYLLCFGIQQQMPSFPISFSVSLVLVSVFVSIATGVISGFAPAWSASRLDPVTALRYE